MNILDRIIPVPQKCTMRKGREVCLKTQGYTLCVDVPKEPLAQSAGIRLAKALAEKFGEPTAGKGSVKITLSVEAPPEGIPNPDQGYLLTVGEHEIRITGFGTPGLFYGVTTLLQLLQEDQIPALEILDYPNLKTRGHFMETRYGTDLMELEDWKEVVDFMVDHKENQLTVSVYGCWQMQFDNRVSEYVFVPFEGYPKLETSVIQKYFSPKENKWVEKETKTPMFEKDFLGQLMAYGKERGVQVIPMINSLGHNTLIPRMYPEVSALDEEGNPSFTGFCTANPKTYELVFDLYDQIIDRYCTPNGIDAFDIGLDEVRDGKAYLPGDVGNTRSPWCKCPACRDKGRGQIVIDYAVKLMQHLKEKGMKTVYMYNDMVVEHKSAPQVIGQPEDRTAIFCEELQKHDLMDVACLDWWNYRDVLSMFHFHTIHPELGLRSTLKPWNGYYNWAYLINAVKNNFHVSRMANDENGEGMRSYSTWDYSYHRNCQTQAEYAWNYAGTGKPQMASARYVRRYFPTAQGEANAAFLLMDDISRWRNRKDPVNDETSRHELFFHTLCFYEYTYFRVGKDYPRNYPGEIVAKLRVDRECLEDLQLLRGLCDQAAQLWKRIITTPGCNEKLAARYLYEVENYRMLVQDALAFVEMDTLAQEYAETGNKALLKAVAAVARTQKQERLAHLAMLEQTKEHYLIPGGARNLSAPMQYFADIEAYLASTPTEDLQLDFSDMRHAASQRFRNLF